MLNQSEKRIMIQKLIKASGISLETIPGNVASITIKVSTTKLT